MTARAQGAALVALSYRSGTGPPPSVGVTGNIGTRPYFLKNAKNY